MESIFTLQNPFQITTPEDLTAEEAVKLFVDVFTDYPQVVDSGHLFLTGPRGIGKSMMLRYLQADCQCYINRCDFSNLKYFGIYIPIKNESFVKTELKRLDDRHASEIFNEHLMVSHVCVRVFDGLLKNSCAVESMDASSLYEYYVNVFIPAVRMDINCEILDNPQSSVTEVLNSIIGILNLSYKIASDYTKKLSFTSILPTYNGPLFDYQDFLVPLLSELTSISGFPKGPIYLLIDDAHFLSEVQTRVLNSWIATRTSRKISLKVSTQYNYKNYYTVTGATIDSPHDYSEINMTTIYTTKINKSSYRNRIEEIVATRLKLASIDVDVEQFFPQDKKQEEEIKLLEQEYIKKYDRGEGKGNLRTDDAYRYARPDFIKSLAGSKKSSSTYSYAGFNQLVHLSSGIVRYFLEAAHMMYSKEMSTRNSKEVCFISQSVQNEVSRLQAEKFLFSELEAYKKEGHHEAIPKEDIDRLSNLVQGLGGLFRQILLSNKSERRVISIAISDEPSELVQRILNYGVNFGYFQKSTIGRKNSKSGGRTVLYVMNRRLCPIWTLDPTGFAGYLFIKNQVLEDGINNPQEMLRRVDKNNELIDSDIIQLSLFNNGDDGAMQIELFEEEGGGRCDE